MLAVPLRGTIQSGAKPHHGTRVDSADPRGEAPGTARHSACQPAPSPFKKLTLGTQCLLFGPTPAGSRSDLCGKGGGPNHASVAPMVFRLSSMFFPAKPGTQPSPMGCGTRPLACSVSWPGPVPKARAPVGVNATLPAKYPR